MIDLENHPEFPITAHTLVIDNLLRIIVEDERYVNENPLSLPLPVLPRFVEYFRTGELAIISSEEIRLLGTLNTPSLFLYLLDDSESPEDNEGVALTGGAAFLALTVKVLLLERFGVFNDDRQHLSRRILAAIQALVHNEKNITDETGFCLTDNLIQTNRLEAKSVVGSELFTMELDFVFGATIEQGRQLPIGYVQ